MECPKCGADNRASAKFCKGCGFTLEEGTQAPLAQAHSVRCSHCGHSNKSNTRFCAACGTPMVVTVAILPTPAVPAQVPSPPQPEPEPPLPTRPVQVGAPPSRPTQPEIAPAVEQDEGERGAGKGIYIAAAVAVIAVAAGGAYYWTQMRASVVATPSFATAPPPRPSTSASRPIVTPPTAAASTVLDRSHVTVPLAASAPTELPPVMVAPLAKPVTSPRQDAPPAAPLETLEVPSARPASPASPIRVAPQAAPPRTQRTISEAAPVTLEQRPATAPAQQPRPAPPAPSLQPQVPADPEWHVRLKGELSGCRGKSNVFTQKLCEEGAKLRYCAPGNHWGTVPECPQPERQQTNN